MECSTCNGSGGWDRSRDIEVYDDWYNCLDCEGTGIETIPRDQMTEREKLVEDIGQLTQQLMYMRHKVEIYETDLWDAIMALESYDSGEKSV